MDWVASLVCCRRYSRSHGLWPKKLYTSVVVTPAPVQATCPNFHFGCRLGWELSPCLCTILLWELQTKYSFYCLIITTGYRHFFQVVESETFNASEDRFILTKAVFKIRRSNWYIFQFHNAYWEIIPKFTFTVESPLSYQQAFLVHVQNFLKVQNPPYLVLLRQFYLYYDSVPM